MMRISTFSIRTILALVIGLMGLLAFALALLSGSIHHDLIFDNQRTMMTDMIRITVKERLDELNDHSQDLGLSLQSTAAFKKALNNHNLEALLKLLNNQFHQYFVTAGIIQLEQLIIFDKNFSMIIESTDGTVFFNKYPNDICIDLISRAKDRTGSQRMKISKDLCVYENRPINAVIVPIGGLRLKGYLMIITNPTHNLEAIEANLGIPVSLRLQNNEKIYVSTNWPTEENKALISGFHLKSQTGLPIVSILTAQDMSRLSKTLKQAHLEVLLISSIGTFLIVVFNIFIMRKTMLNPLNRLTHKFRSLQENKSSLGDILNVTGTKEIYEISQGFNDMSQKLHDLYQSLERMAYTDSLTKLPNRHQFQKHLEYAIEVNKQSSKSFALFLIDLNRFKEVNDTLGHNIGDGVLKAVSSLLRKTLRNDDLVSHLDKESFTHLNTDLVARLGGDEFSVILTNTHTIEDATVVAKKLIHEMKKPLQVEKYQLEIGMSIGIAMFPEHGDNINSLIHHADVAMYAAKNNQSGFSTYSPDQT